MPVYAFLQFFTSSNVLLSSFRFALLYFNAFHFLPLSAHIHILSLSLHAMSKSSQIEYSECMTLATIVVTIYMCVNIEKKKYIYNTQIQKHVLSCSCHFPFISVHIPFMRFYFPVSFLSLPSMFLPFSSIISLFYVHLIQCSSFPSVPSCPSDVPLISLSVRLIFLLIFLSCPFHFTLLSLQFPSLFPSSHAVFLVCPVILGRKIEFPRMFVSYSFHSPWFFIFFHAGLCFFSILYFFRCSAIFLSFYVTWFVFISFPSPFLGTTLTCAPGNSLTYAPGKFAHLRTWKITYLRTWVSILYVNYQQITVSRIADKETRHL